MVSHDDIEQVLRVELLSLRVQSNPCLYQLVHLQILEVKLNWRVLIARASQAREEDLDMADELVDEPLVEGVSKEGLLRPELDYLDPLDPRQSTILQLRAIVLWKRLRHLLPVLRQPVAL